MAVLFLAAIALLIAWWLHGRGGAREAATARPPAPPVPVVIGRVTEAKDDAALELFGSARAVRSVTLYPAVAGEVAEVLFRPGQAVRRGQPLLRLVDREQRLAVDLAAARLDAARKLMARYEATRGTGAVPGSVIDEAASGVELAAIELRRARVALADRELRAPFDGVVGLAQVEPGDRVATDTALTSLDDRRRLLVSFEVPELYAARVGIGHAVEVSNAALGARRFQGRIAQVDSRVDEVTRNLRLRAEVVNTDDLLRPGMSFSVHLALPGEPRPAVPGLALQWGREGSHVWAVREGRVQQVPVRTVSRRQGLVLVEGELRSGDAVVVEGVQRLRPGAAVAVVTPASAPAAAPASSASGAASGSGYAR